MTTLQKLSLRGVRSYSPHDEAVIKFYHPLTIIVGKNGSGKTTIIEALKYICSGELPPLCDKGKSFVYDPDACGEPIVKGQIKLGFETSSRQQIVAVKSFQVTQQKSKRTFRLLDSMVSSTDSEGEVKTLSYKCARMDELMQQLMGVSSAILTNVIFCHQLDANWPLEDDKVLKKKFDDIFAATKYTKALDAIKKFRASQLSLSKDLQRDHDVLTVALETAQRMQRDLVSSVKRRDELQQTVTNASERSRILAADLSSVRASLSAVSKAMSNVKDCKAQLHMLEAESKRAHERCTVEYDETDEQLRNAHKQYTCQIVDLQTQLDTTLASLSAAETREEMVAAAHRSAAKALGRIELLGERLQTSHTNVDTLSNTLLTKYISSSHGRHTCVLSALSAAENTLKSAHHEASLASESALARLDQTIAHKQSQEASANHIALESLERVSSLRNDIRMIERKSGSKVAKAEALKPMQRELVEFENALVNKDENAVIREDESMSESRLEAELQRITMEAKQGAVRLAQLQERGRHIQETEVRREMVTRARTRLEAAEREAEPILDAVSFKLHQFRDVNIAFNAASREAAEHVAALERLQVSIAQAQERKQFLQSSINIRDTEEKKLRLNMKFSTVEEVDEKISTLKLDIIAAEDDVSLHGFMGQMYTSFINKAQKKKTCSVCDRRLSDKELQHFVVRNENLIKKSAAPGALKEKEKTRDTLISENESLLETRRVLEDAERIHQRADEERATLAEVSQQLSNGTLSALCLSERQNALESALTKEKKLKSASFVVTPLFSLTNELEEAIAAVNERGGDDDAVNDAAIEMQLQQAREKLDCDQARIAELSAEISQSVAKSRERIEAERVQRMRADVLREHVRELESLTQELQHLSDETKRYETQLQQAIADGEQAKITATHAKNELDELLQQRSQTRIDERKRASAADKDVIALKTDEQQIRAVMAENESLRNEMKEQKDLQAQSGALEQDAKKAKIELDALRHDVECLREKGSKVEKDIREINANLEYRECKREVERVFEVLSEAQKQLQEQEQAPDLVNRVSELEKNSLQASTEAAEARGATQSYNEQVEQLESSLSSERFRDVAERNRDKMIEVETTRLGLRDLDAYYNALDNALLQYHGMKMKEINETLKELWQTTYRGHDIDFIQILADKAADSVRKQYSYRLVMYRGDVDLDMRGRCSAGQRVLASLLIRLALADTFCARCGILALDEPTLALDAPNVSALADALHALIVRRRSQRAFQLILITHDEKFVEQLGKREHADSYFRVYKDASQHSRIQKVTIRD